ncbi:MAG: hypothetical protein OCC49_01715 [Fibrobacterales bacterium]
MKRRQITMATAITGLFLLSGCLFGDDKTITPPEKGSSSTTSVTSSDDTSKSSLSEVETSSQASSDIELTDSSFESANSSVSSNEGESAESSSVPDIISSSAPDIVSSSSKKVTKAIKDDDGNCIQYTEKTCFQYILGNYNQNSMEENYTGEIHFFEDSFTSFETIKCQLCSDTVRHTKAVLTYVRDCHGEYCDNNARDIEANIEDIVSFVDVPTENAAPVFSLTFDLWGEFSDNQLTYEKTMEFINAGTVPRIDLRSVTFSTDDDEYIQVISILPDTTDGLFYWAETAVTCLMPECFD